jgi:hypothetical protein
MLLDRRRIGQRAGLTVKQGVRRIAQGTQPKRRHSETPEWRWYDDQQDLVLDEIEREAWRQNDHLVPYRLGVGA